MNQAVSHASGEYLLFLNCGDLFADNRVLEKTADFLKQRECDVAAPGKVEKIGILYGDTIGEKNGVIIAAPPKMTALPVIGIFPVIRRAFTGRTFVKGSPMSRSIESGRIMTIFSGASLRRKLQSVIWDFRWHPMRAEVIRKVRKTESGTERNTERLLPGIFRSFNYTGIVS